MTKDLVIQKRLSLWKDATILSNLIHQYSHTDKGNCITRSQLFFLFLIHSFNFPVIRPSLIRSVCDITPNNLNYYLYTFLKFGWFVRVSKGHYQLTDQSIQYINQFYIDLARRKKQPFSFR